MAGDADRLARFQREAELLAALNHPNIAAIYGLEKTPDFTALVMEFVEVRADGTGKVLDFGLAKGMDPAGVSSGEAMNSPTMTGRATQMGIWAFGVVLYEMLSGRRLQRCLDRDGKTRLRRPHAPSSSDNKMWHILLYW